MSLYRLFKILCIPLLIGVLLSGCKNSTNLKDIIIVEGIGIDESEDGKTDLTIQMLNVAKSASNGEAPTGNMTQNVKGQGRNIIDSMSAMTKKLSKDLFFGQTKVIAIGKELAEKGIDRHFDYFIRSTDTRSDVAICISRSKAEKLLESKEHDSRVPCENIMCLLKNCEEDGVSAYITTGQLINLYNDKTSDIYMPVLKGDEKDIGVTAEGIAVFDGARMTATLDKNETNGFLIIHDKVRKFVMELEDERLGRIGVEFYNVKSENHAEIRNSQLVLVNRITASIIINEIERGAVTALTAEDSERICREAGTRLEKNCTAAFRTCQRANSDSIRLGEYVARDMPKAYESCSDDWKAYFASADISTSSDIKLKKVTENTRN